MIITEHSFSSEYDHFEYYYNAKLLMEQESKFSLKTLNHKSQELQTQNSTLDSIEEKNLFTN